jgi:hypothetical protein
MAAVSRSWVWIASCRFSRIRSRLASFPANRLNFDKFTLPILIFLGRNSDCFASSFQLSGRFRKADQRQTRKVRDLRIVGTKWKGSAYAWIRDQQECAQFAPSSD